MDAKVAPAMMPRSTFRRDVTASYVAGAVRIGAWAVVSALVYRRAGPAQFGMLALIRGTIGILNYTAIGLAPALIRVLAESRRHLPNSLAPLAESPHAVPSAKPSGAISQESSDASDGEKVIFSTGILVASLSLLVGAALCVLYGTQFNIIHHVPASLVRQAPWAAALIGIGAILRLFSDVPSAILQTRGRLALDSSLIAAADLAWALFTAALFRWAGLLTAAATYAAAGLLLASARSIAVAQLHDTPWPPRWGLARSHIVRRLVSFGAWVLLAQIAEYFYAPTDYILINRFLKPIDLAAYAPGVQLDMALLMAVGGLAAVLLPRTALAHTANKTKDVREYYMKGTLASGALLILGAAAIWALLPFMFRIWFGPHPPQTRKIIDLVLAGSVIGGSSAVGRSVLMGMGKIRAFTIAALLAGLLNVIASYCFVRAGYGLRGILYGTLVAVLLRCALWMPWYVVRSLRKG